MIGLSMRHYFFSLLSTFVLVTSFANIAIAHDGTITKVVASESGGKFRFDVTLKHEDTGWDHYANIWQVLDADGNVLGTRELAHPHVNEQPFTRSQSGIAIPEEMKKVFIRAGDNVSGNWSALYEFTIPGR